MLTVITGSKNMSLIDLINVAPGRKAGFYLTAKYAKNNNKIS